jgi:iron(III) transport system permease protein
MSQTIPEAPLLESSEFSPAEPPARTTIASRRRLLVGMLLVLGLGALTLAPIAQMLVQSFNVAGFGEPFVFGVDGWRDAASSSRTRSALWYTLVLSLRVPLAVLIGLAFAWFLVRSKFRFRRVIEYSLWFAFFLPTLPIALGWIVLADPHTGLINQWLALLPGNLRVDIYTVTGLLWVHVTLSTVPIITIFLTPALRQLDASLEESAVMCGAGTWRTLWRITLPLVAPAALAATLVGFIRSLEIFEVEQVLGTPAGIDVYATRIYDLIRWDPPLYPEAMALGSIMLIVLLVLAILYQLSLRRVGSHATITGRGMRTATSFSRGWEWVGAAAIMLFMTVGVYLPLVIVALGSTTWRFGYLTGDPGWTLGHWKVTLTDATFANSLTNSLLVSAGAAGIGVICYAVLAWLIARRSVAFPELLSVMVWLPWAVPGLLLGFAWTAIILASPLAGLVWGTLVPLIAILAIKELPLGVQMLRTAIDQVSIELEEAALMVGSPRRVIFRRIVLPLIAPMLGTVFVFTFMMSLRDIGATVLLATPGTKTMAILLFEYAVAGHYEAAAVIGVLMACIALIVAGVVGTASRRYGVSRV